MNYQTKPYCLLLILFSQITFAQQLENKLWYEQPAEKWIESLPVGNGRLGAAVFGGIEHETLGLNISTLWSGEASSTNEKSTGLKNLPKIRDYYFNNEYAEAEKLIEQHLLGNKENYGTHLPMGSLFINFEVENKNVSNYKRKLDISKAIASVSFSVGGVEYEREILASHPNDVLIVRLSASGKKGLSPNLNFKSEGIPFKTLKVAKNIFGIEGDAFETKHSDGKTGVHFFTAIEVRNADGQVSVTDEGISIKNASDVELRICGYTSYVHQNPKERSLQQLASLKNTSYKTIKQKHIEDYQKLYNRASLSLGTEVSDLSTDKRIKALDNSGDDSQLYALFYNYARYLLISGSRKNSPVPTNLQGIWNDNFACNMPWTCDFHLDINTQQNYWLTESGNLSECHEPLFNLIEGMVEPGSRTAANLYGCPGWVAHVVTNAWGFTAPGWGLGWSHHVTGGIWIASHLWTRYEYSLDKEFLKNRAYPVLKGAAVFFDSYLVEDPETGYLVSGPSVSPENKYFDAEGNIFSEGMGTVCDAVLIRDLFNSCIEASAILGIDEAFRNKLKGNVARLQPLEIGKYGQLQEWLEDYKEAVPEHRHTSHLISLFPSSQINPHDTPDLAKAADISLQRRFSQPNWEDVEWSRGNNINFYARLLKSDKALKHLHGLVKENASISMLAYSRGGIAGAAQDIFSIDGNFAGACGISEMLVQSYGDEIYILPALPASWRDGEFRGVCARNGFELNLIWKNGDLEKLEVLSKKGKECKLNYKGQQKRFSTISGEMKLVAF